MALVWAVVVTLPWTPLLFLRRDGLRLRDRAPTTLFSWGIAAITGFWCLTSRVPLAYLLPVVPLFAARLALQDLPPWTARAAPAAVGICIGGTLRDPLPDRVLGEARGMLEMINTMLEISQTGAKIDRSPRTDLDFAHLVRDLGDFYQPLAEQAGLTLRVHVPERGLAFSGHRAKLQQLVGNLLENAIKYTPRGGRIDLSLDTLPEGVRLVVADTGCGISAADLPHIYTRFWRADASRSLPGNGLGLALVKAIVTSYGGRLHCDSVPGQGSAFTVVLPTDG